MAVHASLKSVNVRVTSESGSLSRASKHANQTNPTSRGGSMHGCGRGARRNVAAAFHALRRPPQAPPSALAHLFPTALGLSRQARARFPVVSGLSGWRRACFAMRSGLSGRARAPFPTASGLSKWPRARFPTPFEPSGSGRAPFPFPTRFGACGWSAHAFPVPSRSMTKYGARVARNGQCV